MLLRRLLARGACLLLPPLLRGGWLLLPRLLMVRVLLRARLLRLWLRLEPRLLRLRWLLGLLMRVTPGGLGALAYRFAYRLLPLLTGHLGCG